MKRQGLFVFLFVMLPLGCFAAFAWFNWAEVTLVTEDGLLAGMFGAGTLLRVNVGLGRALETGFGELLCGTFIYGAVIGVLAALSSFAANRRAWRDTLTRLADDNRKLAAANRALEAALPVLREGYDQAIGSLHPTENMLNEPVGADETVDTVSITQLALEDAAARRDAAATTSEA